MRSNHSLLTGASSIETLIEKAVRLHLFALSLTDEDNLYAAVPFFRKARSAGIRPITGSIVTDEKCHAVLLAADSTGYSNLCEIVTKRHLDKEFSLTEAIPEYQAGLYVLTPYPPLAESLREHMSRGRIFMEVIRPAVSRNGEQQALEAARRLGIGTAASCDIYFADGKDFALHQMLTAIRKNRLLSDIRKDKSNRSGYMRSPREFRYLFRDLPGAIKANERIAEECCSFDLLDRGAVFPKVAAWSAEILREKVLCKASSLYRKDRVKVAVRLRHELKLITDLGFADYFLVVADIVGYARSLGKPVAARGSGAGSLAAYCLGITDVDPIKYDLPFERFMNESRKDYPDLDIDFGWRSRDKIIDYVYEKYGDRHVAMICTYATMRSRLAFRESARVMGLNRQDITTLFEKIYGGERVNSATVDRIVDFAGRCNGFPHHLSIHSGGVVITPDAISRHVPLQRAPKGIVITQFDKDAIEDIGLVKIDLLGNRSLSCMDEAMRLANIPLKRKLALESVPERDRPTSDLLARADTVGVNQLESPAMRRLLRQLRPDNIRDLMKTLALIRPGAASLGMKQAFVRRKRRLQAVPKIDNRLDGILKETYGIMLYEDDALLVASALAGLPAGQADKFRREVAKCRSNEKRMELSREFLGHCRQNGVDMGIAADLWVQMAKFNSYSFCRAHAASYAKLAWANAYLKANHRTAFWVAALNNNNGMYAKWVYVEEAKRAGRKILLPCVNNSMEEFSIEDGSIRIGLGQIKDLSINAKASIYKHRPFAGLADFIARTVLRRGEIENVIRCGGLDFTGHSRKRLVTQLDSFFDMMKKFRGGGWLFAFPDLPEKGTDILDFSEEQRRSDEWRLLGMSSGRHPVERIRSSIEWTGIRPSRFIRGSIGKRVRVCGIVAAARTARSGKNGRVCFMTLSDEDGLFELTLPPEVYARSKKFLAARGSGLLWSEGNAESRYDAVSINANCIGALKRVA